MAILDDVLSAALTLSQERDTLERLKAVRTELEAARSSLVGQITNADSNITAQQAVVQTARSALKTIASQL
jgi:outer membrane protein TolC